jgi:PelA/Pel-15E family pectate lyase
MTFQLLVNPFAVLLATAFALTAANSPAVPSQSPPRLAPIDTAGFRDSASHWRTIRDTNRFIQALPQQSTYAREQVREIAANILLFQRENGGWPKDYDMLAILTEEQRATVLATRSRRDTSFDNHNVHSQVDYLARAFAAAGEPVWRQVCERGFDFMLAAQMPNGGFPQRYPSPTGYSAHITFNDGVMMGILNVLKEAADGQPQWEWLDAARRDKAEQAVQRGVGCILKCQIRVEGELTGWCQQHDERTFAARPARTFELASICPQDTTEIVRFLMRLQSPSSDVVRAVDAAVEWMRRVQLSGVRVERVKAAKEEFMRHTADYDVVVVPDPQAPPLWARHYEIGTDRPVFAGRDAVKRYALSEVERERRTGTVWYGGWPHQLLRAEYPKWRASVRPSETR